MDENTTENLLRWCMTCGGWVTEDEIRVRADGIPRHRACDTRVRSGRPPEHPGVQAVPNVPRAEESQVQEQLNEMPTTIGGIPVPKLAHMIQVPIERLLGSGAITAMLEQDIREIISLVPPEVSVRDTIAAALVERGWVPGARRRAVELPKATATLAEDDRYEDQPITDTDGTVIGHVWEVLPMHRLEHPREWVACVDGNEKNRPRFGSYEGAEDWVRAKAPRDGRPLTVPYDAEKVLGVEGEVVGWVWIDPEHAGEDGRWLAVHGAAPEHQHPLWGAPLGMDARNQAIGWVLEQDKEARRG